MLYMPQSLKCCTQCRQFLPATTSYFLNLKNKGYKLRAFCKECEVKYRAQKYREKHPQVVAPDGCRYCKKCMEIFPLTHEYFGIYYAEDRSQQFRSICRKCRNAQDLACYYRNREKINARNRSSPQVKAYRKAWYAVNKKRDNEYSRRYYREHREQRIAKGKFYLRKHRQENKEKYIAYAHNRRARVLAVGGKYTAQDIKRQYKAQKGKCYWCDCELGGKYHVDHVIPIAKGGSNDPSNLVVACPTCNLSKHDNFPWEWKGNKKGRLF